MSSISNFKYEGYDYGASLETAPAKIEDSGTGKAVIIRRFQFKYPPANKKVPSKDQILTPEYIKYLENFLWADNLEMVLWPKISYEKGGFSIFATCKAKKGNIIPSEHQDELRPLQDILTQKN